MEFLEEKVVSGEFEDIANTLLNNSILVLNNKEYRICEIEFYLYDPRTPGTFITPHEDAYTHQDPDQKLNGHWYFHKHKTGTFKGGTFKGMDLIIGDGKQYCGVLIRSIYDMANKKLIEGPCCSVNTVLENYKVSSISELYDSEKTLRLTNNFRNFVLKRKGLSPEPIYKGIRIGLSDKYPQYKEKLYRFLIMKNFIKKGKKSLVIVE